MSNPTMVREEAEQRFRKAKEAFTLATIVMLKSQPEAEKLVAEALREIEVARAELRGSL